MNEEDVKVHIEASDRTAQGVSSAERRIEQMAQKARESLERIALGAGVASAGILAMERNSLNAFAEMERNLKSLDAVERGFLGTTGTLTQKAKDLQDQFFGLSATSGALRNLISSGLGVPEAVELIDVFKERAILLGNATIPLEQRLINLTQAFKTEQSELGDASGLTDNFSAIVERGSQIVGKNAEEMTKAERAQAKYKAIVELSLPFIGQTAQMTESLTGNQAALATEVTKTQQAVGSALAPAYQALLRALAPIVEGSRKFAEDSPELLMTLTTMATGATVATAAVAGLGAALLALRAAAGPVGLIVTGISAAIGAIGGLIVAQDGLNQRQSELRRDTSGLMREYEGLRSVLDDSTSSTEEKERASSRLKEVLNKLFELQPQMRSWFDEEGKLLDGATEKWNRYRDAVVNARRIELTQNLTKSRQELGGLQTQFADREAAIRAELEPAIGVFVENARARGGDSEADRVRTELMGKLQDRVALELADVEAALELKRAEVERDQALLDALNEPMTKEQVLPKPPPSTGGGAGGTKGKPDPFKERLAEIDHLLSTEQIAVQAAMGMYQRLGSELAKTREQERDIEQRVHRARTQIQEEEERSQKDAAQAAEEARKAALQGDLRLLDHRIRLNRASTVDEILELKRILDAHTLTAEERMDITERLGQAQTRHAQEVAGAIVEAQQKGAKSEEDRVRHALAVINHRQRIGELAAQEEIDALQQHLADEERYYNQHSQARWTIEERVYSLKEQLRQEDARKAEETRREEERKERESTQKRLQANKDARKDVLQILKAAEEEVEKTIRARQEVTEKALQREIELAEERVRQYDRQIAREDRLKKIQEARDAIATLMREGEREEVILADGSREMRIIGMVEAEKDLAEALKEHERQTERERLQEQVTALRAQLSSLKEAHKAELDAHSTYWSQVQSIAEKGFDDMELIQDGRVAGLATNLSNQLGTLLGPWQTYAAEVQRILQGIGGGTLPPPPPPANTGGGQGTPTKAGPAQRLSSGAYHPGTGAKWAVVNDVPETTVPDRYLPRLAGILVNEMMPRLSMPTMPSAVTYGSPVTIDVDVHVQGPAAADPQAIGQAVASRVRGVIDIEAVKRGFAIGRIQG